MEANHTVFTLAGHRCELIAPEVAAEGRPFVFRTAFFHAFDTADRALLARGFHLAYCDFPDEYGSPAAVEVYHEFHTHLSTVFGLSPRAALFGFSRGGLYAINYALAYPEAVACLYLDAPVVDLLSWPAGLGRGCGSPSEWEDCKRRVMQAETPEAILAYPHNPVNLLARLAALALPTLVVAGDSDGTVPYEENGARLVAAYRACGSEILEILKPGCDHHPHSLTDPAPILSFVEDACGIRLAAN